MKIAILFKFTKHGMALFKCILYFQFSFRILLKPDTPEDDLSRPFGIQIQQDVKQIGARIIYFMGFIEIIYTI